MFKKRTFFLLSVASIILFIIAFIFFVLLNSLQANGTPYYKITSGKLYSDITVIAQKQQWIETIDNSRELLANKKISENFLARENNLGIIAVPFNTNNKSINDKIVFRIKEQNKKNWFFQSTYNANQIQNNIPFPFGFPIIKNSKNVSYTFEIESLNGTPDDSLSISKASPYFLSKYKFSRPELIKNPRELSHFLLLKTVERVGQLSVAEIIFTLIFFLLPFITYLVVIFLEKKIGFLGLRKKIFKKINRVFWYVQKINIAYPLDRKTKIKLCSLIISVGFFSAVFFHYFQGLHYKQSFPINSFIPNWFFGDFALFGLWNTFKFTGVGYGFSYFPGTYLIVDLLNIIFSRFDFITTITIYLSSFTIFLFLYTYKTIKTDSKLESLQSAFIISMMSYPFLFSLQTANIEMITFIFICLFFIFFKRHRLLSNISLAYAISMKVFPAIFIVLLMLEKRYKDIFFTCLFTVLFTLLPLIIFDGGFNKGIGNYLARFKESQNMYTELMILDGAGNHYGHSLLNGSRIIFASVFPPMKDIIFPYQVFVLVSTLAIIGYLIIFEKIFWRKVAILVMMMNLFPFTSTDYKLLYIFIPLFLLINHLKKDKHDGIFIVLLSLLLIPKNYFYFNNDPYSSFNIVGNTSIMLAILLLIIFSGIRSKLPQANTKNIFNSLLNKIMQGI